MSQPENPQSTQFITNAFGDKVLYEVNRNSFGQLGSTALYDRHFGKALEKEDTLYIIVGTDSGLLPKWLLKNEIPSGSRYLFIELSGLVDEICAIVPGLDSHERISLASSDNWLSLAGEFRFRDYAYLDNIELVYSIGALDAFIPEYHALRHEAKRELTSFTHNIALSMGNRNFVRRDIENAADNLIPAQRLVGSCEGLTAVILGGAPSLDAILPWVRDNRERLTVIAVSRIAGQLLKAGIEPDIVASVDPQPESFDVSKEMLQFSKRCLLLNADHISPPLLAQWPHNAVYVGSHYPWDSKENVENLPTVGPTVSNTALATAIEMGFSQIILGGVDLCFSREGHTHASGSAEREAGPSLGNVGLRIKTNGGWLADTDPFFKQAAEALGVQAEAAQATGCRIINPALQAARMAGVDYVPLDEVCLPEPQAPFDMLISDRLPSLDHAFRQRALQGIKNELARVNGRIRSIARLADEALECNRNLFGRNGKQADFKFKKRMDKIERKLDRDFKDLSSLVKDFSAGLFLRLSRPERDGEWTDEQLEHYGQAYYEAYRTSAQQLLELIEIAQRRTQARLEELVARPTLDILLAQWQSDNTLGRCRVWQAHNPAAVSSLPAEDRDRLERCEQQFINVMNERDTPYARRAKNGGYGIGLGPIRSKLLALFEARDTDELERLAEQLANMDEEEAAELHALAQGYLAEANGDHDAALGHYNCILEKAADELSQDGTPPQNPRMEDALRRMSYITLNQGDENNALMVLDVLSAISPTYEPQYAELLRMTGNLSGAISVYTDYLEKAPQDLVSMLKLGMLYQEIGQSESASWLYRHALEQDPSNSAASQLLDQLGTQASS